MVKFIAQIIFTISLLGIGLIIFRKIPILAQLSITKEKKIVQRKFFLKFKERIKNIPFELFLQKILSKIRVLTLKIENKTANLLQKIREKSQKKKMKEDDRYWQELKKAIKK